MTLRDPVLRAALEEHKTTCLEMGYEIADVNEAVDDLRNMGKFVRLIIQWQVFAHWIICIGITE